VIAPDSREGEQIEKGCTASRGGGRKSAYRRKRRFQEGRKKINGGGLLRNDDLEKSCRVEDV